MSGPLRLADRVAMARRQRFVGRDLELDLFRSALVAEELPFCVLHVFGPGGIGKTSLLRQYLALAQQAGVEAVYLDGRNVDLSPDSLASALSAGLGIDPSKSPAEFMASRPTRTVLLIDTYELLAPLDGWIRESLLPQLPGDTLVVLSGRQAPAGDWRADSGWAEVSRFLPLRNLTPEESRDYLQRRGVPDEQHEAMVEFTHGHPMALSLVADVLNQRPGFQFQPELVPDTVKTLLDRFVQKLPSETHRHALEACALLRLTTEPLLALMTDVADAHDLFEWLRSLSFIESSPLGLFPHDLARDVLAADVRWRNPDRYAELHQRARGYYAGRLKQVPPHEQQRILFDYIYLHRDNPVLRTFVDWQETGTTFAPDSLREADVPALLEMVAQHEGDESFHLAERWLRAQPETAIVFRGVDQHPSGFTIALALERADREDLDADPATRRAWDFLKVHAPLRSGERAVHFRFWMGKESYQALSSIQSIVFANAARYYLTAPDLAFSFFPCADPEFWSQGFAYVDLQLIPEAGFEVGGHSYGVYCHDWRRVPPLAWLDLLAEREMAAAAPAPAESRQSEPLVVLSKPDFEKAVQRALRDFHAGVALRSNPLLRSRLVVDRSSKGATQQEREQTLRQEICAAAESLRASPRRERGYRALYHTYISPAATQEQAAELLDLPFSTYRRHLKTGTSDVAELLWEKEIGEPQN